MEKAHRKNVVFCVTLWLSLDEKVERVESNCEKGWFRTLVTSDLPNCNFGSDGKAGAGFRAAWVTFIIKVAF